MRDLSQISTKPKCEFCGQEFRPNSRLRRHCSFLCKEACRLDSDASTREEFAEAYPTLLKEELQKRSSTLVTNIDSCISRMSTPTKA